MTISQAAFFTQMGGKPIYKGDSISWNFGLLHDRKATENFIASLGAPDFHQAAPHLRDTGVGKNVFAWTLEEKILGKRLPTWNQSSIGSCFQKGTLVHVVEDGRHFSKPIEEVKAGDFVLTHMGRVRKVITPTSRLYSGRLLTLRLQDEHSQRVVVTADHQFLVPSGSWVEAKDLSANAEVFFRCEARKLSEVVNSVEVIDYPVYCLKVEEDESFLANGFTVHNCVSHGWGRVCQDLLLVQIANGEEEWPGAEVAREPIYGGSRVEVGGGQLGGSDGSVGAWAAKWVQGWGLVVYKKYGSIDLSDGYDVQRCRSYGSRGVPSELETEAKLHPVKDCILITTPEQARDAICNLKFISICGSLGRTMQRMPGGWCPVEGNWGHCFLPDTMISGPTTKRIADVEVGDIVYGDDGREHRVTELFRRMYHGNVVRIKAAGVEAVSATEEHPMLVYRKCPAWVEASMTAGHLGDYTSTSEVHFNSSGTHRPCWIMAKDVRPGDYLLTPSIQYAGEPEIPDWDEHQGTTRKAKNQPLPIQVSEEAAWMFGYYIGNGNLITDHGIQFTLPKHGPLDRLCAAIRSVIGLEPRVKEEHNCYRIKVDSVIAYRAFAGWFGRGAENKQLPSWAFRGWSLQAFLDGYLAADGWINNSSGTRNCSTVSRVLKEQLRLVLTTLGLRPSVHHITRQRKGAYANAKQSWMLTWAENPKGDTQIKRLGGLNLHKVRSVMLIPHEGEVFNLEVEDVHTYIADGVIVHNCQGLRGSANVKGGSSSPWGGDGAAPWAGTRPAVVYGNSWGDYLGSQNSQVTLDTDEVIELPPGHYLSTYEEIASDLDQRDTFAVDHATGWPAATIPWIFR